MLSSCPTPQKPPPRHPSRRSKPPLKCLISPPPHRMEEISDQIIITNRRLQKWGEDEYESPALLSFPRELEEDEFLRWLDGCDPSNLSSFLMGLEHSKFASWLPSMDHFSCHFDPEADEDNGKGGKEWDCVDPVGGAYKKDYEEAEESEDNDDDNYESATEGQVKDQETVKTSTEDIMGIPHAAETISQIVRIAAGSSDNDSLNQFSVDCRNVDRLQGSQAPINLRKMSSSAVKEATRSVPPAHRISETTDPATINTASTPLPSTAAAFPSPSTSSTPSDNDTVPNSSQSSLLPPIPENAVLVTPTPKSSTMKLESIPPLIDSSNFSSGLKQYFVNGEVRKTSVEAFPDSGADRCYISSSLASSLGVRVLPGTERDVQLANKKSVESPGMVEVPFKFEGEQHEHSLSCWIIPNCIHDLILGRDFLGATKTLTQYARRIGSKVVSWPGKLRLSYLDGERQRLWGWFGDFFVDALPDTGSDLMLMSGQFARRIGLQADESFENWLEVEFADGTTEWTSGVVRNVPWTVGDTTIRCDFHVLEDLRVDVILSKDYLFGMNAFSEYGKFFSDTTAEVDLYKLYNAGPVGKWNGTPSIFNSEHLDELEASDAESSVVQIANGNGYDFFGDEMLAFPKNTRRQLRQAQKRKRDETRDIFPFPSNPSYAGPSPGRRHRQATTRRRSRAPTYDYDDSCSTASSSCSTDTYKDWISTKRGGGPARLTSKNLEKIASGRRWESEMDFRFYL